jgi:hypothetical protein
MATEHSMVFCKACKRMTEHFSVYQSTTGHVLAVVLTFGLWLPIAMVSYVRSMPVCSICGTKQKPNMVMLGCLPVLVFFVLVLVIGGCVASSRL